ncbi:VOC family protein [Caldibacillus lycopersici]|uniref:VOC family protein n=1 Tax=Perspicuibacillus lycopersici TaxID=1325689 RepID=A0AAE3IW17_9BACI|nr:VOC family protein [Perspicuibacillus lycopersici]MCU9613125.1 VOC family protein [Perspicuibacillus lycopersici]
MNIHGIHHVAIICSNIEISRRFYTEIIGLTIIKETYREERNSYKLDLALGENYIIELFSFPSPPKRINFPEATGLRHIAFEVSSLQEAVDELIQKGILVEDIRIDPTTGKKYTFFNDPDDLPIELYER